MSGLACTMDDELRQVIDKHRWPRCRELIVDAAAGSRSQIGLGTSSDLTALQLAAIHDEEAARRMLEQGVDCDLHSACALGLVDRIAAATEGELGVVAEWLTPMGFALVRTRCESVSALLQAGDDPNRALQRIGFFVWELQAFAAGDGRWMPLHAACTHGYADDAPRIAACLIDAGARLDVPSPIGAQPIHLASIYGWLGVLETLLSRGAAVDARTAPVAEAVWHISAPDSAEPSARQTPLMIAALEGATAAGRLLLDRGADVNARDATGGTPLHAAAGAWWQESVEFVAMLLAAGGDPGAHDGRDRTPRELAVARGYNAVADLL